MNVRTRQLNGQTYAYRTWSDPDEEAVPVDFYAKELKDAYLLAVLK